MKEFGVVKRAISDVLFECDTRYGFSHEECVEKLSKLIVGCLPNRIYPENAEDAGFNEAIGEMEEGLKSIGVVGL